MEEISMTCEAACAEIDWSAIATTSGIFVALAIAIVPSLISKHRARVLARSLFTHDVLQVLLATHSMASPNYIKKLLNGTRPSEKQKRAIGLPSLNKHLSSLELSTELTSLVSQLLIQSSELLWRIETLNEPDIDHDKGVCQHKERNRTVNSACLVSQASVVFNLAQEVQALLYKPTFLSRFRNDKKRSFSYTPPETQKTCK